LENLTEDVVKGNETFSLVLPFRVELENLTEDVVTFPDIETFEGLVLPLLLNIMLL
jgi:hypothetical protein